MKIITGKVISTKMKNTATVMVDSVFMHKLYGKRFKRSKKYHVHDEFGVQVGDVVNFVASKPFSKIKKWKILKTKETEKGKPKKQSVSEKVEKSVETKVVKAKK